MGIVYTHTHTHTHTQDKTTRQEHSCILHTYAFAGKWDRSVSLLVSLSSHLLYILLFLVEEKMKSNTLQTRHIATETRRDENDWLIDWLILVGYTILFFLNCSIDPQTAEKKKEAWQLPTLRDTTRHMVLIILHWSIFRVVFWNHSFVAAFQPLYQSP
jgi:hypothetical protein